jgi:serine/threonine protein kinase/tetratricopeptide (TPR) repeat protein
MGVVYRAVHQQTGQEAALKTVRVPHEGLLQAIRREIHALARIRHPGVVHVLDEGVEQGLPWYAMELVRGKTLQRHCAELATSQGSGSGSTGWLEPDRGWWTHSLEAATAQQPVPQTVVGAAGPGALPVTAAEGSAFAQPSARMKLPAAGGALAEVLTLMRRLCSPLAFLHGEGIVHRDLKPDNVLVRHDDMPVLVDFGLMAQFSGELSRETLAAFGAAGGTLAYMAPEQGRGELVDARADLYALGCILYELVTGHRPFQGTTPVQLLYQHFEATPVAPSELVDGVPAALEELILGLLSKDPRDRPGHAGAVAAALGELGAEDGLASTGPRPRAYLYRPGFAGRSEALSELRRHLEGLEGGAGDLVLVGGQSGIGKTRLILELARQTRLSRVQVLVGECAPGGAPLQALRGPLQVVADRCREKGLEETERLLGRRGKLLALYAPSLAGLPGQEAYPEPAELPAEAARLRLFVYLADSLAALAEDRPVLLLLDDLHWADELTLRWLELALETRRLERGALLVVGTYRTEEVDAPLQRLLGRPGVARLELGRLEEPSLGAMVGDMLGLRQPPERFIRFVGEQSEGNPFFAAEFLRTAVGEGLLGRDELGRWQAGEGGYERLPLPGSVRDLVGRRLDGLPATARELVQVASVLGRDAEESLLLEVARLGGPEAMEAVESLLARQVLEEAADGRLRFVHDKIREVAYERIVAERRQELHRAAAEAIETRPTETPDEHLAALGYHWEQAAEPPKARPCYLAGARHAKNRYAHGEAERLYRAYLQLVDRPTQESIEARNELGTELHIQGHNAEAIHEHGQARDEADEVGDRGAAERSLMGLGMVHWRLGRMEEARGLYDQALAIAREIGDRRGEGGILRYLANLQKSLGRVDQASDFYQQALAIARDTGDREVEGRSLDNLALLSAEQGRLEEACALAEQDLAIAREIGSELSEGLALGTLAYIWMHRGRLERARTLLEEALSIHREVGNRRDEGIALKNLAIISENQGHPDEARHLFEEALAIHRDSGDRRFEGLTLSSLAWSHHNAGRLEEARTLFAQALAIHREVGNRRGEGMLCIAMASVERQAGELGEAPLLLQKAESILRQLGDRLQLAFCLCAQGHLRLAEGRLAADFLSQAQELAAKSGASCESELGQCIERLRRAVEAFEAGRPLYRGELVEDLPAGLRH